MGIGRGTSCRYRNELLYLKHALLEVTKPYYERFRGINIQIKNIYFNDI